jgi:threonine dehydrogenase-like Zn-dependent dehydrogenase
MGRCLFYWSARLAIPQDRVESMEATYTTWSQGIEFIRSHKFVPGDIITNQIALRDIEEGIHQSISNKDIIKLMVNHEA